MARDLIKDIYIKWEEKNNRRMFLAMNSKEDTDIFKSEIDWHMSETIHSLQTDTRKRSSNYQCLKRKN